MSCARASLFGPKVRVMAPDSKACTCNRDSNLCHYCRAATIAKAEDFCHVEDAAQLAALCCTYGETKR